MYTNSKDAEVDIEFEQLQMHSMELYAHAFMGSCSGGFSPKSKEFEKDDTYYKAICMSIEGSPGAEMLCGEGQNMGLLKPTAWASFLSKGNDYVLAFTGTQMHKKEMFVYTTKSSPILFEYKNYVKGYKTGAVVTEGLALYVSSSSTASTTSRTCSAASWPTSPATRSAAPPRRCTRSSSCRPATSARRRSS
jgi:hypothetical protein